MTYNGVGLGSARGTATSGYTMRNVAVQKADSRLKPFFSEAPEERHTIEVSDSMRRHDESRRLLALVAEYEERLREEEGLNDEEEIQRRCDAFQGELEAKQSEVSAGSTSSACIPKSAESFAQAFGATQHREGKDVIVDSAFDAKAQEQRKAEHQAQRMEKIWLNKPLIAKLRQEVMEEEVTRLESEAAARKRAKK